jgi:competence protein ComEC
VNCRLFAEFPQAVERVRRGSRFSPRRWLADFRAGGVAVLQRHIASERATLAAAILLGAREQLDPHRNEDYLVTGTIHILSVSGLHVGILAAAFFFILRLGLLPERTTLAATILLTLCYAALTDLQAPVLRASVLVVVACLALWFGRLAIGFNTLACAALVVLAVNPASLFQAGPQLSFLAVATMIAFAPLLSPPAIVDPLDRLIARTRPWAMRVARPTSGTLWRLWLVGALIWLTSTPLVWQQYGLISPVALVLNTLLWLPISLAMYAGLATIVCGSVLPVMGAPCGWACDNCLLILERTIASGRHWPLSHAWHSPPPVGWIALFYMALGVLCAFPPLRPPRRWLLTLGVAWTALALVLADGSMWRTITRHDRLECTFVSIGHGVSVLVEFPSGHNLLYDSGRLGSPLAGVRPVSAVLWSKGISHLDAIVISHADADHFNAIPGLLERFSVGTIYVSPVMFDGRAPAVAELRAAMNEHGVPIREIYDGLRLATNAQATVKVLHPPQVGLPGSDNANSIVLAIEHASHRLLLTGDLETPGLEEVLIRDSLDCDVVLAPHHGSLRSSPSQFADWSRPEHVIISGRINLAGRGTTERVKDTFRRAGAEVYHTAEDGCIRVRSDRQGLQVTTHRTHVRAYPDQSAAANFLQAE